MLDSVDCITIDSADDEPEIVESESTVERKSVQPSIKKYIQLHSVNGTNLFENFLSKCQAVIKPSGDLEKGIQKLRKRFAEVDAYYKNHDSFVKLIQENIPKITKEPWQCMKRISDELKHHTVKKSAQNLSPAVISPQNLPENAEVVHPNSRVKLIDGRVSRQIAKLNMTLSKLSSKIRSLEEEEVNFEDSDDADSNYMKVSRYKKRFCQVHDKICELKKGVNDEVSPGIRFSGTKLPAVNRAIERFYNDKKEFPDFADILNVVQVVNERKKLALSQAQIHETAKTAFEELGQILKLQRQYDFHEVMCSYIPDQDIDPAEADDKLQEKLSENKRLHGHKIDDIINKFATQQEQSQLEAEEVGSEEVLSASGSEEGEENSDVEDELVTSASDYEIDIEQEKEEQMRLCAVKLPDITQLPIWKKYVPKTSIASPSKDDQQPCCSKSLSPSTVGGIKRRGSGSESDSSNSDTVQTKKCKFSASEDIVSSTPFLNLVKNEESARGDISDIENIPLCTNSEVIKTVGSKKFSDELDSTDEDKPASMMTTDDKNSSSSKYESIVSRSCNDAIENIRTEEDTTQLFDSLVVNVSESLGENNEDSSTCTPDVEMEPETPVNNGYQKNVLDEEIPNDVPSKSTKTNNEVIRSNDDDDVVIIDEIPSKTKSVAKSYGNEIIDIDRLESPSKVPNKTGALDLGAFIKKINFTIPNGLSVIPTPRVVSNPSLPSPAFVPRPTLPVKRNTMMRPNYNTLRTSQPVRFMPVPNPQLTRNVFGNQQTFINQRMGRRTMQSNEVRFMQNNRLYARRRTTTVEESVVQISHVSSSGISNRGSSGSFHNSRFRATMQTTRRLMRMPQNRQPQRVRNTSTDEYVTLD